MPEVKVDKSTRNITFLFAAFIVLQPFLYFLMLLIAMGYNAASILKPLLLFYPLIAFFTVIFFITKNRYLDKIIDYILSGREINNDELSDPVKKYPLESMIILITGCLAAPLIVLLAGTKSGLVISMQHGLFFVILGALPAFIWGSLLYYRSRVIILKYSVIVGLKTPSVREKLSISVLAVFVFTACILYAWIYRIYERHFPASIPGYRENLDTLIMVIPVIILLSAALLFAVIFFIAGGARETEAAALSGEQQLSCSDGGQSESLRKFLYKLRIIAGWGVYNTSEYTPSAEDLTLSEKSQDDADKV